LSAARWTTTELLHKLLLLAGVLIILYQPFRSGDRTGDRRRDVDAHGAKATMTPSVIAVNQAELARQWQARRR
jgi:hypothetical protein